MGKSYLFLIIAFLLIIFVLIIFIKVRTKKYMGLFRVLTVGFYASFLFGPLIAIGLTIIMAAYGGIDFAWRSDVVVDSLAVVSPSYMIIPLVTYIPGENAFDMCWYKVNVSNHDVRLLLLYCPIETLSYMELIINKNEPNYWVYASYAVYTLIYVLVLVDVNYILGQFFVYCSIPVQTAEFVKWYLERDSTILGIKGIYTVHLRILEYIISQPVFPPFI